MLFAWLSSGFLVACVTCGHCGSEPALALGFTTAILGLGDQDAVKCVRLADGPRIPHPRKHHMTVLQARPTLTLREPRILLIATTPIPTDVGALNRGRSAMHRETETRQPKARAGADIRLAP